MRRIKLNTHVSVSINSKPTQPTAEEEYLYHQNRRLTVVSFVKKARCQEQSADKMGVVDVRRNGVK